MKIRDKYEDCSRGRDNERGSRGAQDPSPHGISTFGRSGRDNGWAFHNQQGGQEHTGARSALLAGTLGGRANAGKG